MTAVQAPADRRRSTSPAASPGRAVRTPLLPRASAMLVMAVFTVYFLLPIWWLLVASTKTRGDVLGTNPLWFADLHVVENVRDVLTYRDGLFGQWMANSLLYAGVGSLVATLLAAMCGYALAKYTFRGREAIVDVVLGGVLVPATALALPLFLLFSRVNLTDTYWAVLLPSVVSPFGVYLARIYAAASVPDELIEAARLDGAGEIRTFFGVSVRLMTPALVTVFLFQFVAIWNNFFLPLIMLRDERKFPVTFGLYQWNSQLNQIPELNTFVLVGSLLSIVPLVVAFLALQRFWRGGLGAGSVK
jgi:multiple sugar transport system permease protein